MILILQKNLQITFVVNEIFHVLSLLISGIYLQLLFSYRPEFQEQGGGLMEGYMCP